MKIDEIKIKNDGVDIPYHKRLSELLWEDNQKMKSSVKKRLTDIADLFVEYLEIPSDSVLDFVITGSMANYNWTSYSDIDLHVIVDMEILKSHCKDYVEGYLQSKRKLWNDRHNIQIYGFEVECYPEDSNEVHVSTGVYSIMHDEWITKPTYSPPEIDEMSVFTKAQSLIDEINDLLELKSLNTSLIEEMKNKISRMRKSGLQRDGQYSVENIVFKVLRNGGYIKELFDLHQRAIDKELSLEDRK